MAIKNVSCPLNIVKKFMSRQEVSWKYLADYFQVDNRGYKYRKTS